MKVKTMYQCEKCGENYDNEDDCMRCEREHIMPKEIEMKKLRFRSPYDSPEFKYPVCIRVIMENGDAIIYHHERTDKKDKTS